MEIKSKHAVHNGHNNHIYIFIILFKLKSLKNYSWSNEKLLPRFSLQMIQKDNSSSTFASIKSSLSVDASNFITTHILPKYDATQPIKIIIVQLYRQYCANSIENSIVNPCHYTEYHETDIKTKTRVFTLTFPQMETTVFRTYVVCPHMHSLSCSQ